MIQRKQTLWLLVAAALSVALFFLNMVSITYLQGSEAVHKGVKLLEYNYLLSILAFALIALPVVSIFFYKNLKKQVNFAWLTIVLNLGFIAFHLMYISMYAEGHKPPVQSHAYGIGSFIPALSVVFLFMAMSGMRKDKKLLKSYDRLR